jgi:hypothetical protein
MKRLLSIIVVLGLLGGGGWWVYAHVFSPAEKRACAHYAALCNASAQEPSCQQALQKMRELAGDGAVKKAASCMAEADNCMAANGCIVGAGLGGVGEFFKGMQKALE